MFTIRGVHPIGVRYVHAYMCLNYNVQILKLFRPCLRLIRWQDVAEPFSTSFFSFLYYDFFYTGVRTGLPYVQYMYFS